MKQSRREEKQLPYQKICHISGNDFFQLLRVFLISSFLSSNPLLLLTINAEARLSNIVAKTFLPLARHFSRKASYQVDFHFQFISNAVKFSHDFPHFSHFIFPLDFHRFSLYFRRVVGTFPLLLFFSYFVKAHKCLPDEDSLDGVIQGDRGRILKR